VRQGFLYSASRQSIRTFIDDVGFLIRSNGATCWGEDSDLLRLNVSRQPIEAGPKPGLSAFGSVAFVPTTGVLAVRADQPFSFGGE
jgi:hypothetical protein